MGNDKFVIFAPGTGEPRQGVVRIEPDTYKRVDELRLKTGVSMCRIVSQAIEFALDHMEDTDNG